MFHFPKAVKQAWMLTLMLCTLSLSGSRQRKSKEGKEIWQKEEEEEGKKVGQKEEGKERKRFDPRQVICL
jgi:hypothetical protein